MNPDDPTAGTAGPGPENLADLRLTKTQMEILEALCRPQAEGNRWAPPATNQEIASKVYLSVDAVKAHLRVLYRKFGVEPLPHNQKRARLVELVFEGKVLELPPAEEPASSETPAVSPSGVPEPKGPGPQRRETAGPSRRPLLIAGALVGAAVLVALLVVVFGGSDSESGDEPTPLGEFRAQVRSICGLEIPFQPPAATLPVDERANVYFQTLNSVDDRISRLPPPAGAQPALNQFTAGLRSATQINDSVAFDPPTGRAAETAVAKLTIASGQVQAGAIGSGLGGECKAIAGVIVQSADSLLRPR